MNFHNFYLITLFVEVLVFLIGKGFAKCSLYTTILRELHSEGFHLDLLSFVEITIGGDNCPNWKNCTLALQETIPSSFYASPDQIKDLKVISCVTDVVDTEAPQSKSKPIKLYQYAPVKSTSNLIEATFHLPLHIRYHSPVPEGGYTSANIGKPLLLLHCTGKLYNRTRAPCPPCSRKNCTWDILPYKTNAKNFTLAVPVGDLNHYSVVFVLTYFLTFGGCFYITVTVLNLFRGQQ